MGWGETVMEYLWKSKKGQTVLGVALYPGWSGRSVASIMDPKQPFIQLT